MKRRGHRVLVHPLTRGGNCSSVGAVLALHAADLALIPSTTQIKLGGSSCNARVCEGARRGNINFASRKKQNKNPMVRALERCLGSGWQH